ncbi:hypothetical protein U1Q18_022830 [Sarracenia purpurea var. burkii]
MASLSLAHSFHGKNCSSQDLIKNSRNRSRIFITKSSKTRSQIDPSSSERKKGKEIKNKKQQQQKKQWVQPQILLNFEKFGRRVKDNLSPKQKGDWKDLMLMSLSFAVYVYMSQKIVCAYCAWMSMVKQPW